MPSSGIAVAPVARDSADAKVLKAPPWRGWVTADLFLNSLSAGTFAVAGLCDILAPAGYRAVVRLGYLAAFPLVLADLVCLVIDLGDPLRFHHMLRVFKPRSPMSLGVWSTSVFAIFSFGVWILEVFDASRLVAVREILGALGLLSALVVAGYKGVLLSTTAQPGWKESRWLGAALSISSGAAGAALLLAAAATLRQRAAVGGLRVGLLVLLVLDGLATMTVVQEMRAAAAQRFTRGQLVTSYAISIGLGLVAPLILLALFSKASTAIAAAALTMLGAFALRHHLVAIPQRQTGPA